MSGIPKKTFYYWLSKNPPIIRHVLQLDQDIGELMPNKRIYRLINYHWYFKADEIEQYHFQAKKNRTEHILHHLVNDQDLYLELIARGIPATFCNNNAFLDERIFTVQEDLEKKYDAVYNARMNPCKRHILAKEIEKLLIIGGVTSYDDSKEYFEQVKNKMPHAHYTCDIEDRQWIKLERIPYLLNSASVGLCLSALEGAMFAATEYLLCGLPVVSTISLGGRDVWFNNKYVRIVPDDPLAISNAVQELIELKLSPVWIRQQTLRKVWEHRQRFFQVVQNIYDFELVCKDFTREWYQKYFNKMGQYRDIERVMEYLEEDCPIIN